MNISTLIADDEPRLAENLRDQLRIACPRINVVAIAHDGTEAMRVISELKPQLAFLDICMPGLDGVNVAWHAADTCKIVFVSAWRDYAVEAFAQGAVDYWLTPVTPRRLALTLQRLKAHFPETPPPVAAHSPAGMAGGVAPAAGAGGPGRSGGAGAPWLTIKVGAETRAIPCDNILYFEASGNYLRVVGRDVAGVARQTLRGMLAETPPGKFIQIHRGTAVNTAMIKSVRRTKDGALLALVNTSDILSVGRQFAGQFFGGGQK